MNGTLTETNLHLILICYPQKRSIWQVWRESNSEIIRGMLIAYRTGIARKSLVKIIIITFKKIL